MRQRVMIAIALLNDPDVLIADEPTTALDVTIQAEILDILTELQRERGMAVVFITHDLGVVAELCSRVCVMYAGELVEVGPVQDVFEDARHPYTLSLMRATPRATNASRPPKTGLQTQRSAPRSTPSPARRRTCACARRAALSNPAAAALNRVVGPKRQRWKL